MVLMNNETFFTQSAIKFELNEDNSREKREHRKRSFSF